LTWPRMMSIVAWYSMKSLILASCVAAPSCQYGGH
jgi:hypothetical protein